MNVLAISVSPYSLFVTWSPLALEDQNGNVQFYIVSVTELSTGTEFQMTSTTTELLLENLHPYYAYEIAVSAFTVGVGPFSESVLNTTQSAG